MKVLTLSFLLLVAWKSIAQTISGPSTVKVDEVATFSFTSAVYPSFTWGTGGGTIINSYRSGSTYTLVVSWSAENASLTIAFLDNNYQVRATHSLSVVGPSCAPPVPNATLAVSSNGCEASSATISYQQSPPTGVSWYWQNIATGITVAPIGNTYTVTTQGTYYLRAKYNSNQCWSAAIQKSVQFGPPAAPPIPTISSNTCGSKILTRGTSPSGITLFWQGTNPTGTDMSNSAVTFSANKTGTYYIRAWDSNSRCWGESTSVYVVVNDPDPPANSTLTFCEWESKVLTTSEVPVGGTLKWYDANNQLLSTGEFHTVTLPTAGTYTYRVKAVSAAGCVSQSYGTITTLVVTNCDIKINASESKLYSNQLDAQNNPIVVASSKEYLNGLGEIIQTQSKNHTTGQVLAVQTLFNKNNAPVGMSLPAPINSNSFEYRYNFITNSSGKRYSFEDFDLNIDNPTAVGNNTVGSLGWYYSTNNTLEPSTPTTQFPYARMYQPEGPDPTASKFSPAGDHTRMGSGHETKGERLKISNGELTHYFDLRPHFISTPSPYNNLNTNLLAGVFSAVNNFQPYPDVSTSTITIGNNVVTVACNPLGSKTGIYPIKGAITVTPGKTYTVRLKGYRHEAAGVPAVFIWVTNSTGTIDVVWPGALLPLGSANESWISATFKVPTGVTAIRMGLVSNTSNTPYSFNLTGAELKEEAPVNIHVGYKYISSDGDGKKSVIYKDVDGTTLATAQIIGAEPKYWTYYYYNELKQLIAKVSPNGVVIGDVSFPRFVTTFKYDHLGRVIETVTPDEGRTRFVYSVDGKLRFSQNQEQAANNKFSYTNYDYLGRPVESGEYTMSAGANAPYVFEVPSGSTPSAKSVLTIVDNNIPWDRTAESVDAASYTGISRTLDAIRCTDFSFIVYDKVSNLPTGDAHHSSQKNLQGQVSKTRNAVSTSWYSYDEFGRLEWVKQSIPTLGYRSIDYLYDYFDNVKTAIYQKQQPDAFYHHYTYDNDQRLLNVYTSLIPTLNQAVDLRATYTYFMHGPLKRLELYNGAQKIQGVDFTYSINGLKAINSGDEMSDPGQDGISGTNASFLKDAFGETLHYHDHDFTSRAYNPADPNLSSIAPNYYNGNVRAISYVNSTDLEIGAANKSRRIFTYKYDERNQLVDSKYGTLVGTTVVSSEAQRESIGGYDNNGNISSLLRKGRMAQITANYSYLYETNTNRLDKVNTTNGTEVDYSYNSIGQVIAQIERGIVTNISYYPSGLIKEVKNSKDQLCARYSYDDRGHLVMYECFNAGVLEYTLFHVTDPVGNLLASYELPAGGAVELKEIPIYGDGRIAVYRPGGTMLYEVSDHLGNVRAVIGTSTSETMTATMESEVSEEIPNGKFKNIAPNRVTYSTAAVSGNEVQQLNSSKPVGATIALQVSPGDKLDISTWAYYLGTGNTNSLSETTVLLPLIASGFGGVQGAPNETGEIYDRVTAGFAGKLGNGGNDLPFPVAFITAIVYDRNYQSIFSASGSVEPNKSGTKQKVVVPTITIDQPGYIYICIANRSASTNPVYVDDFRVSINHSPIVVGADYYSFGMKLDGSEVEDVKYRFGYQGQFSEEDDSLGWNKFELRSYNPRIGRWLSPDPYGQFHSPYVGMGNIPHMGIDPDGGYLSMFSWSGALVGAAVGAGIGVLVDKENWAWYALGGAVGGGFFASDFASVKIWRTHRGLGNASALYGDGSENIAKIHHMKLKNAGPPLVLRRKGGSSAFFGYVAGSSLDLPPLTVLDKPKISAIVERHEAKPTTTHWYGFAYNDSWNTGDNGQMAAREHARIYFKKRKMGMRSKIFFMSKGPSLAQKNWVRKVIQLLIRFGVPREDIMEEVIDSPKYDEDPREIRIIDQGYYYKKKK